MRGILIIAGLATLLGTALTPAMNASIDWLLLGATLIIDPVNRPLLLAAGLTFVLAGLLYPAPDNTTPLLRLGITGVVAGSLLTLIAGDHAILYTGFALMSLSAYAFFSLSDRAPARVYITLAMFAEIVLFAGMLALQQQVTPAPTVPVWVSFLVILGFGVKLGLFPVHGTIPVSYKHTPPFAGVILAGSAINCGLLGWLRWLQPELMEMSESVGQTLSWLGIIGYCYAIAIGFTQTHPRAILGYSSVSQMALITVITGAIIAEGGHGATAFAPIAWAALYHGIAKSALFVASQGVPHQSPARFLWWALVILAALSLSGMTFTAGAITKSMLEDETGNILGSLTSLIWLSGMLSAALLTWFICNVQQTTTRNRTTDTLALFISAAALLAICAWAATTQDFALSKFLQLAGSTGFAVLLVLSVKGRLGTQPVLTGDLTSYLVHSSFQAGRYAHGLAVRLPHAVQQMLRRRLVNEGDTR